MTIQNKTDKYYVLAVENHEGMLLSGMPEANPDDPFVDDWLFGTPFSVDIREPVVVEIQNRYLKAELMPYFQSEPVMSNEFYQSLVDCGVNNLMAYDCILQSEDGKIQHKGFKAVNIIGVIQAAGKDTEFRGESRLMDASIDKLDIDAHKTGGALMFRLAENLSKVIVHEKVKKHLESKNFPFIVFRDPGDTLVL